MSAVLPDALCEIFTRLPIDSVHRCRSVCKAWLHVIDGESFVKFYTQNNHDSKGGRLLIRDSKGGRLYSLSLDSLIQTAETTEIDVTPIKLLVKRGVPFLRGLPSPTCNGLVLLSNHRTEVIWNPLNREIRRLPIPGAAFFAGCFSTPPHGVVSTGFGYDHTTDDYKVVRTYEHYECRWTPKIVRRTLVYSLKSERWRRMAKDCTCDSSLGSEGVYLNGRLHFKTKQKNGIVVFDLGTEDYRTMQLPCDPLSGSVDNLCALDGRLVYSSFYYRSKRQKLWVMRDYGVEEGSWVELLNILNVHSWLLNPVAYMESKALLFLQQSINISSYRSMGSCLLCVDIVNRSVKMLKVDGLSDCTSHQFRPGSLIRLGNSNGRMNRKRKMKTKDQTDQKRLKFCVVESDYKINKI